VRGKNLDCDIAIELDFPGEIDYSHSTAADFSLERVLSGKCCLELEHFGGRLCHGCSEFAGSLSVGLKSITSASVLLKVLYAAKIGKPIMATVRIKGELNDQSP
jgi:hypothetical protein